MTSRIVEVPCIKDPIRPAPGFAKKGLADFKLDLCALCGFGCRYCSSNAGNYLRINRKRFAEHAEEQLGLPLTPAGDPMLMYVWPDVIERLEAQVKSKPRSWGAGKTLVFSMLTDAFSPWLLRHGTTEAALRLVLEHTSFRIRILTKNAIVKHDKWLQFFLADSGRFVVGLSIGTMDDTWAKRVEIGTSLPSARLAAMQKLQACGVPTFGMLCPVFPDVLQNGSLEDLVRHIQPERVEHIWAEPYNDRLNWRQVREGYEPGSSGYQWLTDVYEHGRRDLWSRYATELYLRLRKAAGRPHGWLSKLRYLLYEDQITAEDAVLFRGLKGVLLQSKPRPDGKSRNPHIAALPFNNTFSQEDDQ